MSGPYQIGTLGQTQPVYSPSETKSIEQDGLHVSSTYPAI